MPPKAMYLEMETTDLEFEYFLAHELHRTVAEVRQMGCEEYTGWTVYFGRKAQREQLARGGSG